MSRLDQQLKSIVQRTGSNTGALRTDSERAAFATNVKTDLATLTAQLNNVYKPLVESLSSTDSLNALDFGLSGNVIFTHINATEASAQAFFDATLVRPRSIKETVDVLLSELARLERSIQSNEEVSAYDDTDVLAGIALNELNIEQLKQDTMGDNYELDGDGEPNLVYSLSQHVDAIGSLFSGFPGTGNTYTPTYPSLALSVLLSNVTIDTTLPQSAVTNLEAYLGYIRSFIGMNSVGPETPTYSTFGALTTIVDGQSLVEAIQALDEVASSGGAHASTHVAGGSDVIDGDILHIDFSPDFYASSAAPGFSTFDYELASHLKGIDDAIGAAFSGGEANTASNLGVGEGLYSSKSAVDLRFKSLIAGTGITLSSDANEVTINTIAPTVSGTDNYLVRMDGTGGLQDSNIVVDDTGHTLPVNNGTQNLGGVSNYWYSLYLQNSVEFTGTGYVTATGGGLVLGGSTAIALTTGILADVILQKSGSEWLRFDTSADAMYFTGAGLGASAQIKSDVPLSITTTAGGVTFDTATSQDIVFNDNGSLWATLDSSKSGLEFANTGLITTTTGALTLQSGNGNITVTTVDGDIRLAPNTDRDVVFVNSATEYLRADSSARSLVWTTNGTIQTTSGSLSLDASTNEDIIFKENTAVIAAFDNSVSTNPLVLAGTSSTAVTPDVGTRLYTQFDTGGTVGQIWVENTAALLTTSSARLMTLEFSGRASPQSAQRFIDFHDSSGSIGYISGDGAGGVTYQTFTGAHVSHTANWGYEDDVYYELIAGDKVFYLPGMILVSTGIKNQNGYAVEVTLAAQEGDKAVIGVYTNYDIQHNLAHFDANKPTVNYNALGDGFVLVSNKSGDIQNGDLIQSSVIRGYGELQPDDIFRSKTVAKCTQNIDWQSITDTVEHDGVQYKYALVSCTYHCG